jgi:hypothetical protein
LSAEQYEGIFDGERNFLPLNHWCYNGSDDMSVKIQTDQLLNEKFSGEVKDLKRTYEDYTENYLKNDATRFKCLSVAWDNQARRKGVKGLTYINSTPKLYEETLSKILKNEISRQGGGAVVYVNAWNEWAEGAALEPSLQLQHANLIATRNAILDAMKETKNEK